MRPATSDHPFHVMAKPAGPECNLDCHYCFYTDKRELFPGAGATRMSEEVLEELTRQYIESQPAGTPEVDFAWQGGEPTLMGVAFFRRAVELQRRHARPGMRVSNSLQTNGVLLDDDWGEFLRRNGFLVGLSIDGPRELHDAYRRDRGDGDTFERVLRAVELLHRHEVEFNTLTVVHHSNGPHPARVYDFLTRIGSKYLQFIPLVEWEERGETSDRSVDPGTYGRFLIGVFDRWLERRDVGRVFVRDFDDTLGMSMGYPSTVCVHAETCGRALVIEHSGDAFSCDHFVDREHHLGNVLDGALGTMVDAGRQTAFGLHKRDGLPSHCQDCEYVRLCNGGCPKDRSAAAIGGESGLNHLCAGYRLFFGHTLPVFRRMGQCLRMGRPASDFEVIAGAGTRGIVGRNDPCPCGSGRKSKRCCGG